VAEILERHGLGVEPALVDRGDRALVTSVANSSIASREMSQFPAIMSALRNCETSTLP
jgi:hypothetical protein